MFTFFGGTPETPREEENSSEMARQAADRESGFLAPFPLGLSNIGDRVRIVGISDKELTSRLLALRLTPGTELAIVSRAGMAHKILVTEAIDVARRSAASINGVFTSTKAELMNRDTNTYLCNLPLGCRGRVVGYEQVTAGYKGRLLAMGLTPGTEFTVIRHTPLDDLIEVEVRGCKLSLRKHEADVLCIEEVSEDSISQ